MNFYLPTFLMFGPYCSRIVLFKILYDTLLVSCLNGWSENKPEVSMAACDWARTRASVITWIQHFKFIKVIEEAIVKMNHVSGHGSNVL